MINIQLNSEQDLTPDPLAHAITGGRSARRTGMLCWSLLIIALFKRFRPANGNQQLACPYVLYVPYVPFFRGFPEPQFGLTQMCLSCQARAKVLAWYIEAMRHSIPVIAGTSDAGQEVNIDGLTGYNIDLKQPDMLSDRIIRLLKDSNLRQNIGKAGYERWYQNFRYSNFKARFFAILDDWVWNTR